MNESSGGLDLHHHSSNALAQCSGLFELSAEVLELLLQRWRRVGFTARHRGEGDPREFADRGDGAKWLRSDGRS